jgi:hypothetical protein
MSFAIGFNLTASVIQMTTFGRVKHSIDPLRGRYLLWLRGRLVLERI